MNKLHYYLPIFIIIIISFSIFTIYKLNPKDKKDNKMIKNDYISSWKEIEKLEGKGLPKSALEIVETIYKNAKKENNSNQLIKSILHIIKYKSQITEEAHEEMIAFVAKEAEESKQPEKSILQSILADLYWQYYSNNRYKFSQRSRTENFDNKDMKTWDISRLIDEIIKLYNASIEDRKNLKNNPINDFNELLIKGNTDKLRPTLYDFLAHRALDFFMNEETYLTQPAYKFELDNNLYFAKNKIFSKKTFDTKDKTSLKYMTLLILQDLIDFHLNDKDAAALIDVDLKRLYFVNNNAYGLENDKLFLDALLELEKDYDNKPESGIISFNIANYYFNNQKNYINALKICEDVIKKYPDTEGAINCSSLKGNILQKELSFKVEKINVINKPFRMLVGYRNIKKIFFRIIALDDKTKSAAEEIHNNKGTTELIKYYLNITSKKQWEVGLPETDDYKIHSTEVLIPALQSGYYVILASYNNAFSMENNIIDYSSTWISNISFLETQNEGKNNFFILDRETGASLKGVTANVFERSWNSLSNKYQYVKKESYTSDANGFFEIDKKHNDSYQIEFILNNDRLMLNDMLYHGNSYKHTVEAYQTIFFTDRAIYRPGQTIYFKGLVIKNEDELGTKKIIEKKYKTKVLFIDANGQTVSEKEFITNDYGTFNGSFTAPADRLNGQMYIKDKHGSAYFSVEEYKRPKFEVIFPPVKDSFKLDETVKIKGNAKAYAGSNIDQAEVKYRVVRIPTYPYWYWFWLPYPDSNEVEIINGTTTTNENGEFNIEFKALSDKNIPKEKNPVFNYTLYVDVTDINGETHSNQSTIRVGYVSLSVDINIKDKINKDVENEFEVTSYNLNRNVEQAKGSISIFKLKNPDKVFRKRYWEKPDKFIYSKEEFYKLFPYDVYGNENEIYAWDKEKKVNDSSFDTSNSNKIKFIEMSKWPQGAYLLELITKDKFNNEIKVIKYFTLYSNKENRPPYPLMEWVNPIKVYCEPGEKAKIEVGTTEKNVHVFYQIYNRYKIIEKSKLLLNNDKRSITIPVEEAHRGNFIVYVNFVKHNRAYSYTQHITVPWSNKNLKIEFETFRDKLLPGQKEEWKIKISGNEGEKIASEMVAAMYDVSLETFRNHYWNSYIYPYFYSYLSWQTNYSFSYLNSLYQDFGLNDYISGYSKHYDELNFFGFTFEYYKYRMYKKAQKSFDGGALDETEELRSSPAPESIKGENTLERKDDQSKLSGMKDSIKGKEGKNGDNEQGNEEVKFDDVKVRTNLNETAFFFPHLETDKDGSIILAFTMPEALTRWRMMGFAHTKDLKIGYIQNEVVTQKELMVMPNPPRFFREGDKITFSAKVSNLTDKALNGNAVLELYDSLTMKPIDTNLKNTEPVKTFSAKEGQSASLNWELNIPFDFLAVTYRIIAKAGNFSDGEESTIPVLSNRMLVTESLPLPIKSNQTKELEFKKLIEYKKSSTLKNHKLTLEFTSNPAWYAVQALPYMMEYPYECAEQIFSRFYANSISFHIANSNPRIKKVFDSWKNTDALLSNLEKNEELKSLILQETPWVLEAKNENERKKRIGLLFDVNKMTKKISSALNKLIKMQNENGGWPWFAGLPEDRYITQHIVAGMGHLDKLGFRSIRDEVTTLNMMKKAIVYLDNKMKEDYDNLIKYNIGLNQNNLDYIQAHYLYARSFFKDIPVNHKKEFNYWFSQAQKYWPANNKYVQGMLAISLFRYDDKKTPNEIINSLKETSISNEELGMYWKENRIGYYWYQAPIETQALLIEAFNEIKKDHESVDEMKVWLLKQKQTQDWKTTKATAEACYALLLEGSTWLENKELVEIYLGNIKIDPNQMEDVKTEEGTGYFQTSWLKDEIKPEMGKIKLIKKDKGISWGALYWQYFENLDKITPQKTPLNLVKKLFVEKNTDKGPVISPVDSKTILKVGDLIKVRIELRVDRDMEYIHMKDMRASSLEPLNVISQYKYQGGLWYYESTKDAATNFFMPWLAKGTYVFEYPLRVTHKGDFSNGITTIQCMYAPEFSSHSEGVRITVK